MMIKLEYNKRAVGLRIGEKRRKQHLTQEELAEKIEKSLRTIADVERGVAGVSIETLFDLCSALDTTPDGLLLPETNSEDQDVNWLTQALKNCTEHQRATAIDIVRAYLHSL